MMSPRLLDIFAEWSLTPLTLLRPAAQPRAELPQHTAGKCSTGQATGCAQGEDRALNVMIHDR